MVGALLHDLCLHLTGPLRPRLTFAQILCEAWINKGEIMPKGFAQDLTQLEVPGSRCIMWWSGLPGVAVVVSVAGRSGRSWWCPGGPGRPRWSGRRRSRVAGGGGGLGARVVVVVVAGVGVVPVAAARPARAVAVASPSVLSTASSTVAACPGYLGRLARRSEFGEYGLKAIHGVGSPALSRQPGHRHDPEDQAWREGLDQHSRHTRHPEACSERSAWPREPAAEGVGLPCG